MKLIYWLLATTMLCGAGPKPKAVLPCSANNTTVPPNQDIIDASGNTWAIVNGQVSENGVVQAGTENVVELAWVIPVVWQENSANNWYSWLGTTWSVATTTSPIATTPTPTPVPKPTPSPDNTVIIAPSTAAIIDASGNSWTITAGAQMAENGTAIAATKNVTELAWEKGVVWQENTSGNWYSTTGLGPTTVSPVPTTPTPVPTPTPTPVITQSPDKTVVLAGSAGVITDSLGNLWTISSGEVLENGKAPAFSSNVSEIAYVGSVVYQGNAANQWYAWVNGAWAGGANPFTSTCTYNPSAGQFTCTPIP
jgi:hypothetical protein